MLIMDDTSISYETFSHDIENRNYTNVCRFCLADAEDTENSNTEIIAQLFKAVTNVDLLLSSDYPTYVCSSCETNLRTAAKTRKKVLQMENCWKKFINEMPLIEEIKIEEVGDDENISFETVEMIIEPMYSSSAFDEDVYDVDMKTGFEVNLKCDVSEDGDENYQCLDMSTTSDCNVSYMGDILDSSAKEGKNDCQFCNVTDLNQIELRKHQRNCHAEMPESHDFICDICGKAYSSRHGIHSHMKRHVQDKANVIRTQRYKCSTCVKTFSKKSQLNEHEFTHSDIPFAYICHICGVGKKSRHLLNNHVRSHNPDTAKKGTTASSKPKSTKRYYTCWLCPTRIDFKSLEDLKCHRKNFHHQFECEFCKNGFMSNEALQSHILIHRTQDRPHVCKFCGGTFSKIGHLNSHIQGKHAKQKPHPCDKCPKGFVHRYQLLSHIRIFHEKIKAFQCTECSVSFGHAKSRVWHMRTVHNK